MDKAQHSPAISLIIPCWNNSLVQIERALKSVEDQTFQDYEIIVVDDGSGEEYHGILEEAVSKTARCRLLTLPHKGVSNARNQGILDAKGRYIAFLDADDVLVPVFLERSYHIAESKAVDFVIGGVKSTEEKDGYHFDQETGDDDKLNIYRGEEIKTLIPHFICGGQLFNFADSYIGRGPVSRLIRREFLEGCLFHEDLTLGEDLVWNLELFSRVSSVCIAYECWYLYTTNQLSASRKFNPNKADELEKQFKAIEKAADLDDDRVYYSYVDHIYGMMVVWAKEYYRNSKGNSKQFAQKKKEIYSRYPWKRLAEKRFFRLADRKLKTASILYRMRLLFLYFACKEKLKA